MRIGIIDLNSGNLLSMVSAVKKTGHETIVIKKPIDDIDVLIMPGQGRFGFVANQLDKYNWRQFILDWISQGKKFIGICVGMQLLFESSNEDTSARGLGVLDGTIEKLEHEKTPMVGWAQLKSEDTFYKNQFVYFVNSFGVPDSEHCIASVKYGNNFCAAVKKENIIGFQFHPEKSGDFGLKLIKRSLED
ncbi:MAG: imidazole glycerol phosphate synthase subunit HisH [Marinicellaceae bacterium]